MKWEDLKERVKDTEQWEVHATDAVWMDGDLIAYVFIFTDFNELDPVRKRISLLDQDILFGCYFLNIGTVMYDQLMKFGDEWTSIWKDFEDEEKPKIIIQDAPPDDFRDPISYEWTPKLLEEFPKYQISKTGLARLWGQPETYYESMYIKIDSGPETIPDDKVLYNQRWVEDRFKCPFCGLQNPSFVGLYKLRYQEQNYYDPDFHFLCALCPRCSRTVEVVPRNFVDKSTKASS